MDYLDLKLIQLLNKHIYTYTFLCVLLFVSLASNAQISGSVYKDFNSNGSRDIPNEIGVANILVSAYIQGVATPISTTSDINGNYVFAASQIPAGSKVRLEFTQLDGQYAGIKGTQSQSTVQFVTAGAGVSASLGILDPKEYCGLDDIEILTTCYVNGNALGGGSAGNDAALVSFPVTASGLAGVDGAPGVTYIAKVKEVGSTWGLTYQVSSRTFFVAALYRRHSGLGILGTGGIYTYNNTTKQLSNFLNLKDIGINTGPDSHVNLPANKLVPNEDSLSIHAAGKVGIGGIALSQDEKSLYIVNLYDKRLYRIFVNAPAVAPTSSSAVRSFNIPDPSGVGDSRPWAVNEYKGSIYVGVVNSAQQSQDSSLLKAYIYKLNESTGTFTEVFSVPLNYHKGALDVTGNCIKNDRWFPWLDKFPKGCATFYDANTSKLVNFAQYPQPILSSIAFDLDGSLLLGFMDRFGLMSGYRNLRPVDDGMLYDGFVGGDLLRAQYDAFSKTWTLESNGKSGSLVGTGVGNGQGPGGGEFFGDDYWKFFGNPAHLEVLNGGVLVLADKGEIITSAMDPVHEIYQSGGMRAFDRTNGSMKRGYALYSDEPGTLGKSGGVGDFKFNCSAAPLELGNRIWNDINFNGIQDPNEPGVANAVVELYDMSNGGTLVNTLTTSAIGTYCFNNVNTPTLKFNTDYEVRVKLNQTPLVDGGYIGVALKDKDASPNGDERDSDGTLNGSTIIIPINSGFPGKTSHNNDIGLIQCQKPDAGSGIAICEPATTSKLNNAGLNQKWIFNSGPSIAKIDSLTGAITGLTQNGDYTFILIFNPAGLTCSDTTTVKRNLKPNAGADLSGNNAICIDHTQMATLTAVTTNGTWTAAPNNPSNALIDKNGGINGLSEVGIYSFIYTLNGCSDTVKVETKLCDKGVIGDFVWMDKNRNGIQDSGEVGVPNVIIELCRVDASGNVIGSPVAKDTTDANGLYQFKNLASNSYIIKVVGSSIPSLSEISNKVGAGTDSTKDSDVNPLTLKSKVIKINNATSTNPRLDIDIALQASCVKPNAGNDVAFCAPQTTYKLPNAGNSQYWKFVSGPVKATIDSLSGQIAGISTSGSYKFMLVYNLVGTTCSDTVTIAQKPKPYAGKDSVICSSLGSILLSASISGGTWNAMNTNPKTTTISSTGQVSGMTTVGIYNFIYTLDGCADTVKVEVVNCETGSIGNFVWMDKNRNGIQDSGEVGVPNVIIELCRVDASGNVIGSPVAKDTTDANGLYQFKNLASDSYIIKVVGSSIPSLSEISNKVGAGTDSTKDSDVNPLTLKSKVIKINNATSTNIRLDIDVALQASCVKPNAGNNIAFCAPQSSYNLIDAQTGQFWKFIVGPTGVVLDSLSGQIEGMTANGTYKFMLVYNAVGVGCSDTVSVNRNALPNAGSDLLGLTNGICRNLGSVQLNGLPSGGTWTALNTNPANATISSTGLVNGMSVAGIYTFVYTNNSCSDTVKVESLVCEKGTIGDKVWLDSNENGLQDTGEKGVPNVIVELYKVDINGNIIGLPVAKDTTGATGNYLFTNLPDGSYKVKIVLSSIPSNNALSSLKDVGTNDAIDSDFDTLGLSPVITINNATLANNFLTVDAALVPVCKIICVPLVITKIN